MIFFSNWTIFQPYYPPVIKHGLLKNPTFLDESLFHQNLHWVRGFPSQECLMTPNGTVDFWVAPCLMVNPIVNLPVYPIILPLNPIKSVVFTGKSHHFGSDLSPLALRDGHREVFALYPLLAATKPSRLDELVAFHNMADSCASELTRFGRLGQVAVS